MRININTRVTHQDCRKKNIFGGFGGGGGKERNLIDFKLQFIKVFEWTLMDPLHIYKHHKHKFSKGYCNIIHAFWRLTAGMWLIQK